MRGKHPVWQRRQGLRCERKLCDIARGQKTVDSQVVVPAMRAYAASRDRNVSKLMGYARKLGVERKIRGDMEALL